VQRRHTAGVDQGDGFGTQCRVVVPLQRHRPRAARSTPPIRERGCSAAPPPPLPRAASGDRPRARSGRPAPAQRRHADAEGGRPTRGEGVTQPCGGDARIPCPLGGGAQFSTGSKGRPAGSDGANAAPLVGESQGLRRSSRCAPGRRRHRSRGVAPVLRPHRWCRRGDGGACTFDGCSDLAAQEVKRNADHRDPCSVAPARRRRRRRSWW
jgi:hypothetical protein